LEKSVEWKGEKLGILEMRRHYTNYFRGMQGIKAYRAKFVTADEAASVYALLEEVANVYAE
jgi:tRNA-dihydrouridine synthase